VLLVGGQCIIVGSTADNRPPPLHLEGSSKIIVGNYSRRGSLLPSKQAEGIVDSCKNIGLPRLLYLTIQNNYCHSISKIMGSPFSRLPIITLVVLILGFI
jgi:hypothetical protein